MKALRKEKKEQPCNLPFDLEDKNPVFKLEVINNFMRNQFSNFENNMYLEENFTVGHLRGGRVFPLHLDISQ